MTPPDEQDATQSAAPRAPGSPLPLPGDREAAFAPGATLAGRFRIVGFLGQGGMGEVYEAEDQDLKEQVALKTIRPEIAADERAIARFKREIHLARRVTHPNVCRIFDLFRHQPEGTARPVTFLSMELLRGQTLADRLRRGGPMSTSEAAPIVRQMAAALEAAHRVDVIHRDFKSANVMLVPGKDAGEAARVVVTDFGLARLSETGEGSTVSAASITGGMVGTPAYMAPEQVTGGAITPATDIYALGIVLYEMVTGKLPFEGDTPLATAVKRVKDPPTPPRRHVPELDPVWESAILRCLEREPAARFSSASETLQAFEPEPEPAAVSRPWQLAAASVTLLLVVGGVAGYYLQLTWKRREAAPSAKIAQPIRARRSVAVLGFKDLARRPESAWLSTALSEMLTTELAAGEKLRTISGENVARMKADLALAETDSLARDTLARVRANLGTDLVVLGSYTVLAAGGQIRLDLRLQDAVAGEIIASVAETGTEPQLFELVSRTGARLREKLGAGGLSAAQASQVRASVPANPEAARLYAEGIAKLRQFDPLGARDRLEKAARADPKNALVHFTLAGAWDSLGYDAKALQVAKRAYDLSANLSREGRLSIEGRYRETGLEWDKSIEIYRSLTNFFPDNLEYGLRLAAAQTAGGKGKDALATTEALRKLPAPASDDPRIDLAEAVAARTLADSKRAVAASARAAAKGAERGAQLLVARARFDEGSALHNLGELDKAIASLEEAKRLFAAGGDLRGLAGSINNHAVIMMNRGDLPGARKMCEQALALYRKIGNQNGVALMMGNLGNFSYMTGDLAGARRAWQQTLETYREIDDKEGMARMMNNMASALGLQGDLAGARKMFEGALGIYREIGNKSGVAVALDNIANTLRDEGRLTEAKKLYLEAQVIWREIGDKTFLGHSLHAYGELLKAQGDLAAARKALEESLAVRNEIGAKAEAAESRLGISDLLLEEGRHGESETTARELVEVFRQRKDPDSEASAHAAQSRALLAQGKTAEAQAAAARAAALSAKSQKQGLRLAVTTTVAQVRAAAGKPAEARQLLQKVIADSAKAGLIGFQFDARLALAEVEKKFGQAAAARAGLEALEKEAAAKGFGLIARKAAAK